MYISTDVPRMLIKFVDSTEAQLTFVILDTNLSNKLLKDNSDSYLKFIQGFLSNLPAVK